jgi:hypothetical protein
MSARTQADWHHIFEMEPDLCDLKRGLRAIIELGGAVNDRDVGEAIVYVALQMRGQAANLERLYFAAHGQEPERDTAQ